MSCSYEEVAVISYKVIDAILDHLQWMTFPNNTILCVGLDHVLLEKALKTRYPDLTFLKEENATLASADWVIAHLALPYVADPLEALWRWRAYLKPNGMLFCTHFGPDTLQEWQVAQQCILPTRHDMHELGDLLIHAGFSDPVIDVDYYYTRHRIFERYLQELKLTYMIQETTVADALKNDKNEWMTTYEIVFAHAFSSDTFSAQQDDTGTVVKIPVSTIKKITRA